MATSLLLTWLQRRTLLTIFFQIAMSSQLTSLVPVLDGTNYNQWAAAMQSFLMSQGQWWCTKPGFKPPVYVKIEATEETPATDNHLCHVFTVSRPFYD